MFLIVKADSSDHAASEADSLFTHTHMSITDQTTDSRQAKLHHCVVTLKLMYNVIIVVIPTAWMTDTTTNL